MLEFGDVFREESGRGILGISALKSTLKGHLLENGERKGIEATSCQVGTGDANQMLGAALAVSMVTKYFADPHLMPYF